MFDLPRKWPEFESFVFFSDCHILGRCQMIYITHTTTTHTHTHMRTYAHTFSPSRLGRVPPQHLPNLIPKEHAIRLTDLFYVRFELVFSRSCIRNANWEFLSNTLLLSAKTQHCYVKLYKLIYILVNLIPFKMSYLMPKIEKGFASRPRSYTVQEGRPETYHFQSCTIQIRSRSWYWQSLTTGESLYKVQPCSFSFIKRLQN